MPSISASEASSPGPAPNMTRPRVMWSSWMMRSATISGLWYGSETTPVPRRMFLVRSAATAMNSSGERDDLLPGRMMFADPGLVEPQPVEYLD